MIKIEDFNFLLGHWKVLNRRLNERLVHCNEWTEFPAEMETRKILNGLGIIDEMKSSHFGENFIGLSIRMVNPVSKIWTIYWADTHSPENYLKEQVSGVFEHGIGQFFGTEFYQGKEYPLRFVWKKFSAETAHWEQAYFDPASEEWETNWTMDFTRINK